MEISVDRHRLCLLTSIEYTHNKHNDILSKIGNRKMKMHIRNYEYLV